MPLPTWVSLASPSPTCGARSPSRRTRRQGTPPAGAAETEDAIRKFEESLRERGLIDPDEAPSSGEEVLTAEPSPGAADGRGVHLDAVPPAWACRPGGDSDSDDDLGLPSTLKRQQDNAATRIQAGMRGRRARKKELAEKLPPKRPPKWPFTLSDTLWVRREGEFCPQAVPREQRRRRAAGRWPRTLSDMLWPKTAS
eukprot:TRINITY_DN21809_c0_g1_i1.p2 TRINITY_DN21809_c0_g1~~TRINITY_DN21809_c0_g1_i1.p2  ORF type:complete len:219 (+),score=66.84 TRINITY_DN21809_c0_g1_i1:69-659(+)